MVMKNMQYYNALLLSGIPLFVVGVLLSPPEISLHPHAQELLSMMLQAVIDIVEGYVYICIYACCMYLVLFDYVHLIKILEIVTAYVC